MKYKECQLCKNPSDCKEERLSEVYNDVEFVQNFVKNLEQFKIDEIVNDCYFMAETISGKIEPSEIADFAFCIYVVLSNLIEIEDSKRLEMAREFQKEFEELGKEAAEYRVVTKPSGIVLESSGWISIEPETETVGEKEVVSHEKSSQSAVDTGVSMPTIPSVPKQVMKPEITPTKPVASMPAETVKGPQTGVTERLKSEPVEVDLTETGAQPAPVSASVAKPEAQPTPIAAPIKKLEIQPTTALKPVTLPKTGLKPIKLEPVKLKKDSVKPEGTKVIPKMQARTQPRKLDLSIPDVGAGSVPELKKITDNNLIKAAKISAETPSAADINVTKVEKTPLGEMTYMQEGTLQNPIKLTPEMLKDKITKEDLKKLSKGFKIVRDIKRREAEKPAEITGGLEAVKIEKPVSEEKRPLIFVQPLQQETRELKETQIKAGTTDVAAEPVLKFPIAQDANVEKEEGLLLDLGKPTGPEPKTSFIPFMQQEATPVKPAIQASRTIRPVADSGLNFLNPETRLASNKMEDKNVPFLSSTQIKTPSRQFETNLKTAMKQPANVIDGDKLNFIPFVQIRTEHVEAAPAREQARMARPKQDLKICPRCKELNPISSRFCFKCGHKFEMKNQSFITSNMAVTTGEKICPRCNNRMRITAKFCNKCGSPL
ncbi:MAG: zinc-ribbon domain-containing protein [Promethearchaeota archaeon]